MAHSPRIGGWRPALVAGWLLAAGVPAPGTCAAATPARAAYGVVHGPAVSVKDSPGYIPLADPESTAVVLGRRTGAPAVSARFTGGCRSLEELGRAVLWALHHADADSLRRLCVDRREFSEILWPEFPESRPATGLTADDAWGVLDNRFSGGVRGAVDVYGGRPLVFRRIEVYHGIKTYRNFRVLNGLRIVATNEDGKEEQLFFVRAAAERKGRFKIESTTD
jgi:hypothetical protein